MYKSNVSHLKINLIITYTKKSLKICIALKVRTIIIEFFKENTRIKLNYCRLGKVFLYMTPKAQTTEENRDKLDLIKI